MVKVIALALICMYFVTLIPVGGASAFVSDTEPKPVKHTIDVSMKVLEYGWDRNPQEVKTFIPPEQGADKFDYNRWVYQYELFTTDDMGFSEMIFSRQSNIVNLFRFGHFAINIDDLNEISHGNLVLELPCYGPNRFDQVIYRVTEFPIVYEVDPESGESRFPVEINITVHAYPGEWTYFDPIAEFVY
jgi:hypothetical protein